MSASPEYEKRRVEKRKAFRALERALVNNPKLRAKAYNALHPELTAEEAEKLSLEALKNKRLKP